MVVRNDITKNARVLGYYKTSASANARYGHHRDPPEPSTPTKSETDKEDEEYKENFARLKAKGYEYNGNIHSDRDVDRHINWATKDSKHYKKEGFVKLWTYHYYPSSGSWDLWYNHKYESK